MTEFVIQGLKYGAQAAFQGIKMVSPESDGTALATQSKAIIGKYAQISTKSSEEKVSVTAGEIKALIASGMSPLKALIIGTGLVLGGTYVGSKYAPVIAPLLYLLNKVALYFGLEFLIAHYQMHQTYLHFQRQEGDKEVEWTDFTNQLQRCADDISASTIVLHHLFKDDLLKIKTFVEELQTNEMTHSLEDKTGEKKSWQQIATEQLPTLSKVFSFGAAAIQKEQATTTQSKKEKSET